MKKPYSCDDCILPSASAPTVPTATPIYLRSSSDEDSDCFIDVVTTTDEIKNDETDGVDLKSTNQVDEDIKPIVTIKMEQLNEQDLQESYNSEVEIIELKHQTITISSDEDEDIPPPFNQPIPKTTNMKRTQQDLSPETTNRGRSKKICRALEQMKHQSKITSFFTKMSDDKMNSNNNNDIDATTTKNPGTS